jgi:CubicO group peptidase (beta-lactamase class C family)
MKVILLLITITCLNLFTFSQSDKHLKGVEKELNEILEITKSAGFAVAVVKGNEIIYSKGFGYRDYENKIPVDNNTLFAIGSSTKAFTSSILGQLRKEDKLSFDESPIKYVSDLKFFNDEMNNSIVIKDLMSHRTGLPRHDWSWYVFPTYDKDSLMRRIEFQEPFTGVRKQWYYNNFMFLTQGVIAERITGKSWEENMYERLLRPLKMLRSNLSIKELVKAENVSLGYEIVDDKISKMDYYRIAGMSPAGSMNSSVNEMSNWLMTWLNKGKFEGNEIIPEAYINEAMSSQMVINGALPDDEFPNIHMATYGYGWMLSSYKGHYRVEHGGNIDGFSADVIFFPSDSIGIVVLANQNVSSVPSLVRNTIADRLINVERTDWIKKYKDRKAEQEDVEAEVEDAQTQKKQAPQHQLKDFTGHYENLGYGQFEIIVENDSLFAVLPLWKLYLEHKHFDIYNSYRVTDVGIDTSNEGLAFNFQIDNEGEVYNLKLKIEPMLEPLEFIKKPKTIDVEDTTLHSYVGEYDLSGTILKTYIKEKNTLYLFVKGQPEYELLPTDKHKFSFKVLDGFKVEFIENEEGKIGEIKVIQPNGTFRAVKKK